MVGFMTRRMGLAVLTIAAISVLSFVIIQLPKGDYIDNYILTLELEGIPISLEEAEALRAYYGMDKPLAFQYLKWIGRMLGGDFGYSYQLEIPVKKLIAERLLFTVVLTGTTVLVTWTFAIPVGIYSAVRQHSVGDYTFTFLGFTGLAVPDFLLGLLLMYLAFAYLDISVGGLFSQEYLSGPLENESALWGWSWGRFVNMLSHLWIPAVVLGTAGTASLIRIMRNNLLDELSKAYVVTARSKGLKNWRVIVKYPVRVAINPLVSGIGYLLPALVGGSVIVSVVMSLPTMGPLLLRALLSQDMFLAGTIILFLGILTIVGTLISDILLVIVDPRIKMVREAD